MITKYYICPYDVEMRYGPIRTNSMVRHIPYQILGVSTWEEVEILNNHLIVKVRADTGIHDKIKSDIDFTSIEDISITAFKTKLIDFGYASDDLNGTMKEIIDSACLYKSRVSFNTVKNKMDILERVSQPTNIEKNFDRIPD